MGSIHAASRAAALIFAIVTAYLVWAPPRGNLVSSDDQPSKQDTKSRHSGWELSLTPSAWKALFASAFACQTIFQIYCFQHYAGGWTRFTSASWSTSDVLALVLMGAAARLRRRAYKALGKYFTYKVHFVKDQELVGDGPYTNLMHPGYSALLMHILPFLYFIGLKHDLRVLALYTVIGLVPFTRRILDEEKALEKHFGKQKFEEYRSKRWHLIPFIW